MLHNLALLYTRVKAHKELKLLEFGAGTHVGNLRDNNEDSYVCDPETELWIVADGMGGLGFGEVASAISTYTVATQVKSGHGINQAIENAHKKIKEFAETEADGTNMGTTLVLLLSQGSLYNIFWVGDSRAYLFAEGKINQLTSDHSLVQSLIEQGEITQAEAITDPRKNVVTRALGVQEMETVRADSISEKWLPGQKILLCSDGLSDCVEPAEIEQILNQPGTDQEKVDTLIESALKNGGNDNITVVIVSASATTRQTDHDTDVPDDVTDSTLAPPLTPSANANKTNANRQSITAKQTKTDNSCTTSESPAVNTLGVDSVSLTASKGIEEPAPLWATASKWAASLVVIVALLVLTRLSIAERTDLAVAGQPIVGLISEMNADAKYGSDGLPISNSQIPDIPLPESGAVFQLGIFSKLQGAELRQQALSRKGYLPFIEKKVSDESTQYAVLLGPYYNETDKSETAAALAVAGINHFERPESHY